MASKAGPKIVKDDLVLCLDAHDANSYEGEPTTNLSANSDYSGAALNNKRSLSNGGWGTTFDNFITQIKGPGGKTVRAYNLQLTGSTGSSPNAEGAPYEITDMDSQYASLSSGNSYRVSAWAKVVRADGSSTSHSNSNVLYLTGTASLGSSTITVGTEWTKISASFSISSTGTYRLRHYFYSCSVGDTLIITEPQIELKGYNTPYVKGSRSESVDFMVHASVGSGTTFKDSSPSNLSLTNQNSVSRGGTSIFGGNAIQFSSSSSQQLTTGSTTVIDFGTDDWTIDFWFNITSGSTARMHALSCGGGNTNNLDFNFNDASAFWLYWNSSGSNKIQFGNDGDYGDGNWHHLMATRSSGMVRVWVDGVHKGSNDYDSSTAMGQSASIYVGGKNGVYWDGFLDEIRIIKGTAIWSGSGNFTPPTSRHKSGAIADISGRHLGGRFVNGATTGKTHYRDGQVISAVESAYIDFDGTNDYVQCRSIQLSSITAFTVELWINPDVVQDYQNPIDCNYAYNGTTGNIGPRLELRTGTSPNWIISGDTSSNNNYYYINARSSAPSAGNWCHVALTYDGSGTTSGFKSYWDGSLVVTGLTAVNTPSAVFVNVMNSVELGHGFHLGSSRHFNGKISSTKIYKKALTASEIKSNFDAHRSRFGI